MKYLSIILFILLPFSLMSQQQRHDVLEQLYYQMMHPADILLNGREYKYYFSPRSSTPLIPKDPIPNASVLIRDKLVQDVILMYDTYSDQLVYYDPNNPYNDKLTSVVINSHLVKEFTLQLPSGNARFRYLEFPEDRGGGLSNGFYEVVSDGDCKFIVDHHSTKSIRNGKVAYQYKTERYIICSGTIYKIKGKNSLLRALSDQYTELEQYLKTNRINVRTADKEQITELLDYYKALRQ